MASGLKQHEVITLLKQHEVITLLLWRPQILKPVRWQGWIPFGSSRGEPFPVLS